MLVGDKYAASADADPVATKFSSGDEGVVRLNVSVAKVTLSGNPCGSGPMPNPTKSFGLPNTVAGSTVISSWEPSVIDVAVIKSVPGDIVTLVAGNERKLNVAFGDAGEAKPVPAKAVRMSANVEFFTSIGEYRIMLTWPAFLANGQLVMVN